MKIIITRKLRTTTLTTTLTKTTVNMDIIKLTKNQNFKISSIALCLQIRLILVIDFEIKYKIFYLQISMTFESFLVTFAWSVVSWFPQCKDIVSVALIVMTAAII